ncbi:MAG: NAD-dependent epimerase/dehydratase family protein [Nitrospinaceae bacterium]|nr:NAD-dependent epimerase/dehydratase family protein [Nitrospinaceae bacterium]MBT3820431.1 NAD-dependent epimerase/dehydratase family protein [Nitrospinaceae bacterium]MBT4095665.1 NAD-dependent epimerase/dehydratase family protein [Nitrospinaceae bacterium]MBT4431043.1 NAD-dependent epimerase/dehydratase family protein [Nitrospinaceae bacterium]MBT5367404.1 NAD-dependent epimerase/dehydratase family protein [Nitrospinaceae bacterium]
MSTYLVTGAAGFVGSNLCERLIGNGARVVGVDRFSPFYGREDKEANLEALRKADGFKFIEMDLAKDPLEKIVSGVDGVFHLAAQAGVRDSWGQAFSIYLDDNNLSTQRLLEACRDQTLKAFVYASSSSIYGDALEGPTKEDAVPRPVSPYGVSKLAGEHLCYLYHRNFGIHTVALRYFTVYGPRQRPDMAFRRFLTAGIEGNAISVFGDGEQSRDFTYVADAVEGTYQAMQKGAPAAVYNIGGGQRATLNEVIALMGEIQGVPLKEDRGEVQKGDVRHTWADTSFAKMDLDFQPKTNLRDGLRAEHEWLLGRLKK